MGKNKNKRKKKNQVSGGGFHNVDLENRNSEDKNLKDKSNDKKKKKHEKKEKDEKKTKKTTNEPEEINNYQNNSDDSFDYDEDQIPPDWTIAEEHFLARRSAPEREDENLEVKNRHCKCCGYIVEREEVPLNIDYRQLGFLGVGFPLFFYYIISCIYVLLIIFCISAIFNLATNNYSEDCFSQSEVDLLVIAANAANNTLLAEYYSDKECVLAWATRLSIGNKRDHIAYLTAQRWLNLVTIVVLIIYFQIMRRNQRKIEKVCDESLATPSDYAVMVTDIKKNLGIDYDDELKVFFEQNAIPGKKANIVNVNLAYNMHIKIELENKKDDFVKIKQKALAYKNHHGKYPILYNEGRNENEIRLLEEKILAIDKEFQSGKTDQFCGIAFVVFATEDEKSQCLKAHYKTFKERAYLYFADNFKKVFKQIDETQLFFHDQRCLVFEAPEPSDVYWQNLHYTLYERYIRNIIADSFSIFILSCFGVGIYYLNYYQAVLNDNNKTVENLDEGEELTIKIIGSVISISVSLVIEILKILIPLIALFEKNKTRTEYFSSVAMKLSIASFCTSSLITFIITVTYFKNYFGGSGLVNNQIIIFITNLIVPSIVQMINFPYIIRSIKRKIARSAGKLSTLTQEEANKLFTHPEFNMQKAYAQVGFTMIFTGFYANLLPLGIIFSIGTLILLFWIYKYNILKKSTILYDIDSSLAYTMSDILELTALTFALSEFVFTKLVFDEYPLPSILCLAVAGANWMIPSQFLNEKLFKFQVENETKTYNEAEDDFDTDYARENPATGDLAREAYEKKEEEEEKLRRAQNNKK